MENNSSVACPEIMGKHLLQFFASINIHRKPLLKWFQFFQFRVIYFLLGTGSHIEVMCNALYCLHLSITKLEGLVLLKIYNKKNVPFHWQHLYPESSLLLEDERQGDQWLEMVIYDLSTSLRHQWFLQSQNCVRKVYCHETQGWPLKRGKDPDNEWHGISLLIFNQFKSWTSL